jgi:hypothetical protein
MACAWAVEMVDATTHGFDGKEERMSDLGKCIEEATTLLASRDEAKALQVLRDAIDTSHDPGLVREIHDFATQAHESSHGFHKIEWHRLMIETEPQTTSPAST